MPSFNLPDITDTMSKLTDSLSTTSLTFDFLHNHNEIDTTQTHTSISKTNKKTNGTVTKPSTSFTPNWSSYTVDYEAAKANLSKDKKQASKPKTPTAEAKPKEPPVQSFVMKGGVPPGLYIGTQKPPTDLVQHPGLYSTSKTNEYGPNGAHPAIALNTIRHYWLNHPDFKKRLQLNPSIKDGFKMYFKDQVDYAKQKNLQEKEKFLKMWNENDSAEDFARKEREAKEAEKLEKEIEEQRLAEQAKNGGSIEDLPSDAQTLPISSFKDSQNANVSISNLREMNNHLHQFPMDYNLVRFPRGFMMLTGCKKYVDDGDKIMRALEVLQERGVISPNEGMDSSNYLSILTEEEKQLVPKSDAEAERFLYNSSANVVMVQGSHETLTDSTAQPMLFKCPAPSDDQLGNTTSDNLPQKGYGNFDPSDETISESDREQLKSDIAENKNLIGGFNKQADLNKYAMLLEATVSVKQSKAKTGAGTDETEPETDPKTGKIKPVSPAKLLTMKQRNKRLWFGGREVVKFEVPKKEELGLEEDGGAEEEDLEESEDGDEKKSKDKKSKKTKESKESKEDDAKSKSPESDAKDKIKQALIEKYKQDKEKLLNDEKERNGRYVIDTLPLDRTLQRWKGMFSLGYCDLNDQTSSEVEQLYHEFKYGCLRCVQKLGQDKIQTQWNKGDKSIDASEFGADPSGYGPGNNNTAYDLISRSSNSLSELLKSQGYSNVQDPPDNCSAVCYNIAAKCQMKERYHQLHIWSEGQGYKGKQPSSEQIQKGTILNGPYFEARPLKNPPYPEKIRPIKQDMTYELPYDLQKGFFKVPQGKSDSETKAEGGGGKSGTEEVAQTLVEPEDHRPIAGNWLFVTDLSHFGRKYYHTTPTSGSGKDGDDGSLSLSKITEQTPGAVGPNSGQWIPLTMKDNDEEEQELLSQEALNESQEPPLRSYHLFGMAQHGNLSGGWINDCLKCPTLTDETGGLINRKASCPACIKAAISCKNWMNIGGGHKDQCLWKEMIGFREDNSESKDETEGIFDDNLMNNSAGKKMKENTSQMIKQIMQDQKTPVQKDGKSSNYSQPHKPSFRIMCTASHWQPNGCDDHAVQIDMAKLDEEIAKFNAVDEGELESDGEEKVPVPSAEQQEEQDIDSVMPEDENPQDDIDTELPKKEMLDQAEDNAEMTGLEQEQIEFENAKKRRNNGDIAKEMKVNEEKQEEEDLVNEAKKVESIEMEVEQNTKVATSDIQSQQVNQNTKVATSDI